MFYLLQQPRSPPILSLYSEKRDPSHFFIRQLKDDFLLLLSPELSQEQYLGVVKAKTSLKYAFSPAKHKTFLHIYKRTTFRRLYYVIFQWNIYFFLYKN